MNNFALNRLTSTSTELSLALNVSHELRVFNPASVQPQTLEQLHSLTSMLGKAIPEIGRYDIATLDGRREFPRLIASLAMLGGFLRAADALEVLDQPVAQVGRRVAATRDLHTEYDRFVQPQNPEQRLSFGDFTEVTKLFRPISQDPLATFSIAVSLVYGDLFKMASFRKLATEKIKCDSPDHDTALQQALQDEHIQTCRDLFPTLSGMSETLKQQVRSEAINGINLGHVLQVETCAADLTTLQRMARANPEAIDKWFLVKILDIFGARAEETKPTSWFGSELGNKHLVPALLTFATHLPTLASSGEVQFFDSFQRAVAARPFYTDIFRDPGLPEIEKNTVFRLARFLSWETDNRPVMPLIESWKGLDQRPRDLLVNYFMNTGFDPANPKPIVTYLPYVFTQMYARHLPLQEALSKSLSTVVSLLERIDEHQNGRDFRSGIQTYSGQNLWFNTLKAMPQYKVEGAPIRLAIAQNTSDIPEVILESSLLSRNAPLLEALLAAVRAGADAAFVECETIVNQHLNDVERETLRFVNSHTFSEGAWYRPIHNLLVTMAMVKICEHTGASRDLVLAAILHDVGYAALEIPGTLKGSAWNTTDTRISHMQASAIMGEQFLRELMDTGRLLLSEERLHKILEIIATHDNPYIGIPLTEREALLHRDADRLFVASCISFWKDYIARLSDPKKLSPTADGNSELTPEAFLETRQASFITDPSDSTNRSAKFEPMTSPYAEQAVLKQLASRAEEIQDLLPLVRITNGTLSELTAKITRATINEFRELRG